MKVLLTGATSFIGISLANRLVKEGHTVYAIVRSSSKSADKLVESTLLKKLDIDLNKLDERSLAKIDRLDLCIHLAWSGVGAAGRMDRYIQAGNIAMSIKLLELLSTKKLKRFIFAGSQAEYGVSLEKIEAGLIDGDTLIKEDFLAQPISEYGKAKLKVLYLCESFANKHNIEYIHLRIFSCYGYMDHETSLISTVIRELKAGRELTLSACRQSWNYIYIDDCVRAISSLTNCRYDEELKKNPVFNIASKKSKVLYKYALDIADILGLSKDKLKFEERPSGLEGTAYLNPDIAKLEAYTGFVEEFSFEEGIREIEKMYTM